MRNLRKFLSSGLMSGSKKRRRPAKRSRKQNSLERQLSSESLEKRELLAGDVLDLMSHNYHTPYDVNADYRITAGDAQVVLTKLYQLGAEGELSAESDENQFFLDVNNDGRLSASDALGVINALGRGEGVGELVEMFLTARDKDDNAIQTVNGEYNIAVDEKFFLEVAYSDLRTPIDANGIFQIRADVISSLPDYLVPVMTETQRLRFDPDVYTSSNLDSVTFTQEGTGLTYVSSAAGWQSNDNLEVFLAMQHFGYELGTDYSLDPTLQFAGGDRGYLIHWIGDDYDDVDVPNISITIQQSGGQALEASVTEFAPYLAGPDGVLETADDIPNSDAVQFNLDLEVRTWSPFHSGKTTFYDVLNTGEFDTQRDDDPPRPGFITVGGVGANSPNGVKGVDGGFVGATPNDAFSLPVKLVQPVQGLIVNLTPSFDADNESVLLYGESVPLVASQVVLDSYDGTGSPVDTGVAGVAHVIINGIGENRDPQVSGPITQTFTQNDSQTNVDLLEFASDPDNNSLSVDSSSVNVSGNLAGVLVSGNEAIVDPSLYSFLAASEQEVVTVSYDIVDGAGGSVAQTATITITGLDDAATGITGDTIGSVTEDGTLVASGSLTVEDLDAGDDEVQPQTNVSGTYGSFSIDASGSWTYSLNNADLVVQALAVGDAPTDQFSVVSKDGAASVDVIVTINGTNDVPTKSAPITATFSEEQPVTSVDLLTGASDVDQSDVLSVANYEVASGDAAGVSQNGNNVDVDPGAYGTLEDGESEVIVLNYDIVDGNGGSVGQTATITVTGVSNFSPVITVEVGDSDIGEVSEQEDTTGDSTTVLTDSGTLSFSDQDLADTHTVTFTATESGYLGTFGVDLVTPATGGILGQVAWSFSASDADLDQLADGEVRQQVYDVTVTDSSNGTDVKQVFVTLNGENDQPQSANPIDRDFNSSLPIENIDLTTSAADVDGDVLSVEVGSVVVSGGNAGGVAVDENSGVVTVTPVFYDFLTETDPAEVVEIAYTLVDGNGGSIEQTATLTFNGVNDPPSPGSAISATFSQNDSVTTVSLITGATDPDDDVLTVADVSFDPANPAGFQIVNDDSVEVTPSAYVSLNDGEQTVIEINYVIDDGAGNQTAQQTATITITGENDTATITGDATGAVVEDTALTGGQLTDTGTLAVNDVDVGQAIFSTSVTGQAGNLGSLVITEAGVWSYTLDNSLPSVQELAAGVQITDSFTVVSLDGTATENIVITITGVNDVATISGNNEGGVTEDDSNPTLATSGNLSVTDVDAGEAVFDAAVIDVDSPLGALSIDAAGAWNYTLDNTLPAVQSLPAGATLVDKFEVKSFDQSATETVTVTITGINDIPVFGGDVEGDVQEDDNATLTATGELTISDVDTGESFVDTTVSTDATLGTLVILSTGEWTYEADNSQDAIQALVENQSIEETFTVTSSDGSQTQVVTITINGTNDAPEAVDEERLALKDGDGILVDALSNDNAGAGGLEDPNQTISIVGDSLQLNESATLGTPGGTVAIEDGKIRYVPGAGFEGTATIDYQVSDGDLLATGTLTVTVVDFVPSTLGGSVFIDNIVNWRDVRDHGATPFRNGVQDEGEKGFASIRIKLVSDNNYTNNPIEREVLTDVDGKFEFTDIAPGVYKVVYEQSDQIRFEGELEHEVTIPALGDVQRDDLNYGVFGTQGSAMAGVGLLASSYLRTDATIAQISDGGREGGLVCLDSTGQQSFIVLGAGFEEIEFAELELNEANDAALLTVLREDGQRLSTVLTEDFFVVSSDECGIQFFGSLNDHVFTEAGLTDSTAFDDTRTAVDDFEDNNNDA